MVVDGEIAVLGTRADPARARIEVDGVPVVVDSTLVYWLLNKPAGYVTTARDPQGRPTVIELVPGGAARRSRSGASTATPRAC